MVSWGDSYHTLPSSLVDKGDVSLVFAHAEGDTLDGFMAALPQWDLPVVAGDPSSLPWRLIWTWHPVLEAFGHNKSANSSYSPDPWFYPAELVLITRKMSTNSFLQKLRTTKIMSLSIPYTVSLSFITPPNPATK